MGLVEIITVELAVLLVVAGFVAQSYFLRTKVKDSLTDEPLPLTNLITPDAGIITEPPEPEIQYDRIKLPDGTVLEYVGESIAEEVYTGLDSDYLLEKE